MSTPADLRAQLHATLDLAITFSNGLFNRVVVLDEAASTQDEARARHQGKAGLVVAAIRQTAGRGTRGRTWADTGEKGLAITFVLQTSRRSQGAVSLAAGVAAAFASTIAAGEGPHRASIGIKWPNDIVAEQGGRLRKLGGVLIEAHDKVLLVGIGLNVLQVAADFPPELRESAISLCQLQSRTPVNKVAGRLTWSLAHGVSRDDADLVAFWKKLDKLTGRTARFMHDFAVYEGVVEHIDPLVEIHLRTAKGAAVRLPARSTSLVKD